jgi:hypothetical protein
MSFVADINAGGMGMDHFQADFSALYFPHHFPPLLAVHLVPFSVVWVAASFLSSPGFFRLLAFHANLSMLNSTWLGPGGETYSISPAGSGHILFRTPPPSTQSPIPEPC